MASIQELDNIITRKIPQTRSQTLEYILRKNIEYNVQYLDFLASQIFTQTIVIKKMIAKNFLIVAFSIIEGVLSYELKKNNLIPHSEWEQISIFKANPKQVLDDMLKVETVVYHKIETPQEKSLTFKQKIDIAQNNKIFGNAPMTYKELCRLNKLRNKVHLHNIDEMQETDYNRFNCIEFENIKMVFLDFLRFYFDVSEEEIQKYFKFLLPISYN